MSCAPGLASCRASCLHRRQVDEYRAARHAAELAAEAATSNYPAELAAHIESARPVTFKSWLTQGRAR